jgi:hypothetical protein
MNVFIVFNKENEIISIHKNREYAMQVAEDYIRSFGFSEEDCAECLGMLADCGYVDDLVWIETHEVDD